MSQDTHDFAENPYRFLEKNIVVTGDNPPENAYEGEGNNRLVWVSIDSMGGTDKTCPVEQKGKTTGGKMFNMVFGRDQSDAFRVYWCPYKSNSDGDPVMLGNASNYMFTVTMNACTLGIGSQTDGAVRVAHANQAKEGKGSTPMEMLTSQGQSQLEGLQKSGLAIQVISPMDYMLNGQGEVDYKRKSTTFGMHRTGRAWAFFTLQYRHLGGGYGSARYEHLGVIHGIGGRWGTW